MLTDLPSVSVIILTHNGSRYIEALLESLHNQSYPDERMEIIVVDNASTDNTLSIVEAKYPHANRVRLNKNYGFAAGNNLALEYAGNEYVAFLNQDTLCHKDWLKGLVEGLLLDESIGACASNMIRREESASCNTSGSLDTDYLYYYDISLFGYGIYYKADKEVTFPKIISGCSFIIRKKTIESLGYLFDEDLKMYTEDTDLSLRIHNQALRVCVFRKSVVFHLHEKHSKIKIGQFSTAARAIRNRVVVFYKNMSSVDFLMYLPFLIVGGPAKIMELPLSSFHKAIFFIPFSLFSMGCMISAIFVFPSFYPKRKHIIESRKIKGFHMLKLLLKTSGN